MPPLFDLQLRAMRRDRAARNEAELFLYERTFADCLERVALMQRQFGQALLIGSPDPTWPERLGEMAAEVDIRDPGPAFARSSGGETIREDEWDRPGGRYDLVIALGTLDTVNDLPRALRSILRAMQPGGFFIGALSGGNTTPQLRAAMRAADEVSGEALAHIHPRIETSALGPLLASAGFSEPVVDLDRVQVSYRSFDQLVRDLRAMGTTNILNARPRTGISRSGREAAIKSFAAAGNGERTIETFEILHFAAWAGRIASDETAMRQR